MSSQDEPKRTRISSREVDLVTGTVEQEGMLRTWVVTLFALLVTLGTSCFLLGFYVGQRRRGDVCGMHRAQVV